MEDRQDNVSNHNFSLIHRLGSWLWLWGLSITISD